MFRSFCLLNNPGLHLPQPEGWAIEGLNTGDWNRVDIYCYEGTAVHFVNGEAVMVLHNSLYKDNGRSRPLRNGKIQIQSEGAELFYRNIKIRSIDEIPDSVHE